MSLNAAGNRRVNAEHVATLRRMVVRDDLYNASAIAAFQAAIAALSAEGGAVATVEGLRQGNWHHPDGGRIVGWVIEPDDKERMKADAFCLPCEVAEALENLRSLSRPADYNDAMGTPEADTLNRCAAYTRAALTPQPPAADDYAERVLDAFVRIVQTGQPEGAEWTAVQRVDAMRRALEAATPTPAAAGGSAWNGAAFGRLAYDEWMDRNATAPSWGFLSEAQQANWLAVGDRVARALAAANVTTPAAVPDAVRGLVDTWHDRAAELDEIGDVDGSTLVSDCARDLEAALSAAPEGCGACGDGCKDREGCRLAEDSPPAAAQEGDRNA